MTRILIVEDETHLAEGLRFNLEAEGYEVIVTETGEAALDLLLAQQQPFGRGRGHVAQQFGQRALQRAGNLQQHQDRSVADAVFQVG